MNGTTQVAEPEDEITPGAGDPRGRKRWPRPPGISRFSGLYAWAIVFGVFALWVPDTFLTSTTLTTTLSTQAIVTILAISLVVPLAAGAFDLSVGFMAGFAMVATAWLGLNTDLPDVLIVIVVILACTGIGWVTGLFVVRFGVSSLMATIAMGSLLQGASILVSENRQISGGVSEGLRDFGLGTVEGVPASFLYLLGLGAVLWYVLEHTPVGRYLYATGGNPEAARLSGIRTDRLVWGALMTSAAGAGFAGVVLAAKVGVSSNEVGGPFLLPAFAAVFLGETQVRPGRANVVGTIIAAYLLATGIKGLQLVEAGPWIDHVFNGAALLLAVSLAHRLQTRSPTAKHRRARSAAS